MAGIHGNQYYGIVDRVPGVCVVVTMFSHFNFLPIWPTGSYILPDDVKGPPQRSITALVVNVLLNIGHPILESCQIKAPMNARSVALGYLRGWVGGFAWVSLGYASASFGAWTTQGLGNQSSFWIGSLAAVSAGGLGLFSVVSQRRIGTFVAVALAIAALVGYLISIGWVDVGLAVPPPRALELIPWSVGALMLVRLSYLFTPASPARTRELMQLLGYSADDIESYLTGQSFDATQDVAPSH